MVKKEDSQEKQNAKVQRQIKALQKRLLNIEYYLQELEKKPEVRQIGFVQHYKLQTQSELENE